MAAQWITTYFRSTVRPGPAWEGDVGDVIRPNPEYATMILADQYIAGTHIQLDPMPNAAVYPPARDGDVQLLRGRLQMRRDDTEGGTIDVALEAEQSGTEKAVVTLPSGVGTFTEYTIEGDAAFWGISQAQLNGYVDDPVNSARLELRSLWTGVGAGRLDVQFFNLDLFYEVQQKLVFPPVL